MNTQTWGKCLGDDGQNIARISCVIPLFENVVKSALFLAGTLAVIMIIYGGLRMVLSGGDAKQAGAARSIITYAIIGLVIVFLSFAMLNFLSYITNVDCIKEFGTAAGTFENCGK